MAAKILVTGATGNTGSALVAALRGKGVDVRALVRDEAKAQPLKDQGAEIYVGNLDNPPRSLINMESTSKTSVFSKAPLFSMM